jgi:predicted DNA-binding protein
MPSVTIRIPSEAHERARRLAKDEARPIAQVIATALDRYERERMIADYWAAMERLRADPEASAEFDAEVAAWDAASLADLKASLGDDWNEWDGAW